MDGYVIRRLYSLVVYVVQALWIVASSGWMLAYWLGKCEGRERQKESMKRAGQREEEDGEEQRCLLRRASISLCSLTLVSSKVMFISGV